MILLLIEPVTAKFVSLHIPGDERFFKLFTRNGWRPFGEQARQIAAELYEKQIEEIASSISEF